MIPGPPQPCRKDKHGQLNRFYFKKRKKERKEASEENKFVPLISHVVGFNKAFA